MSKKNLTYKSRSQNVSEQTPAPASADEEAAPEKDAEGSKDSKDAEPPSSEAVNAGKGGTYRYIGGGRRVKV